MFGWSEYVDAGGLMSYGPNFADVFRQIGGYVGRLLKGAKPAELPVIQPPTATPPIAQSPPVMPTRTTTTEPVPDSDGVMRSDWPTIPPLKK